ncbi:MAG: HD domain-containing protein [Candidatus Aenigmatarchaeota archaeon]
MQKEVESELEKILKGKVREVYFKISNDQEVKGLLEQANNLSISRLGYNDHGEVHSKIVALNSLKMFEILIKSGLRPTIVKEGVGDEEDSKVAILLGAYLHDIGCSISRDSHEIMGAVLSFPIIKRILNEFYPDFKLSRISCFILEAIISHMGNYEATSLEARIVEVADGTDITKGRARIPFHIGKKDIHKFSALAIEKVEIREGKKKPIRVEVFMENPAGIFQTEEIMLKKIRDARLEECVEVVANIKGESKVRYI